MEKNSFPQKVYQLRQGEFRAIPSNPWIYWFDGYFRQLFKELPKLKDIAQPRVGLQTANNPRFLRYWWEVGSKNIFTNCINLKDAILSEMKWFPISKGSKPFKWAGSEYEVVNWKNDGNEMKTFSGAVIRNPEFYFKSGIILTRVGPSGFNCRINPGGHLLDSSISSCIPDNEENTLAILGILNSNCVEVLLMAINPTINFQVGDLSQLPLPILTSLKALDLGKGLVLKIVHLIRSKVISLETTLNFISPPSWTTGLADQSLKKNLLESLETQLNEQVYKLYGFSQENKLEIIAELPRPVSEDEREQQIVNPNGDDDEYEITLTSSEFADRWISFSVGIILGQFHISSPGLLGSAIYRIIDFKVDSLVSPTEEDINGLIGSPDRFSYIDENGGRHVFTRTVEETLRAMTLPDGIAVLDAGHPRDLPALVQNALELMLGADGAREVIQTGASGGLRKYLEKEFFTRHHFSLYRNRPVYWPIQSAKRTYGFVIFHEKITRDTFYAIQRDPYLDTKRNAVELEMQDVRAQVLRAGGAERKRLERRLAELDDLRGELAQFAKDLEEITLGGYEPELDWIDDGVILRMAPLWKVIPLWKNEPKKYWERLAAGEFDWSHIAMKYWPERVRKACKQNKSYAIAHGHEEWYEGR